MTIHSASRTDIRNFHAWLKQLPKDQSYFLYNTYLREEDRQAKLKELFDQWLNEISMNNT